MMNIGSGSGCWKSGDVLPEQFPMGLRVLVVDDDSTCLAIIKKMLWKCRYQVTACKAAEVALSLLRQNKNGFDIVLSDVHMPDMNGFKLLEHIGLEMDIPVIMMSADDNKEVVMEGVTHGAYDYLIKPVRIDALRNIWQHIVRKRRREWMEAGDRQQKASQDVDHSCSESWKNSKKRKEEEEEAEERDDTSSPKKPRVVWSVELHQQFVLAVHQLGIDKAVPKKILELMNVPGLTRENVASHLQKYRLYLRRVSGVSPHQNELNNFNGLDLQAVATINQIPAQGFATLQAAALGRFISKSTISMPLVVDQRNPFSLENFSVRFPEGKKLNHLLHGIPTTMKLKQLPNLRHPSQSFGGVNTQVSSMAQHNTSVLMRTPQAQPMVDLLVNLSKEFQSNNFSLGGNSSGMSTLTNRGMLQEEANSDIRGSRGFPSNYDIVNQLHQPQLQNWGFQNVGSTSGTCHHPSMQGTQGVSLQQLLQQGIPAHNNGQDRNVAVGKLICSDGEQSGDANLMGGSDLNSVGGNIAERFLGSDHESANFLGEYGQGDLMSIYLQQQRKKG